MEKYNKKLIIFEIDTTASGLKRYYNKKSSGNAYYDLRKKMLANGFVWQGGPMYVSTRKVSYHQISMIMEEFVQENPWAEHCIRDFFVVEMTNSFRMSGNTQRGW